MFPWSSCPPFACFPPLCLLNLTRSTATADLRCMTLYLPPSCPLPVLARYYNDVWEFSLEELKWAPLGPKPGQVAPSPRGGCQLALYGDALFMFGGYSVRKPEPPAGEACKTLQCKEGGRGCAGGDGWSPKASCSLPRLLRC